MLQAVVTFVITGIVAAILLGLGVGFDPTAYLILGLIALTGLGAVLIARKFKAGLAGPARCAGCGGYISPNAPYCKHCNETVSAGSEKEAGRPAR